MVHLTTNPSIIQVRDNLISPLWRSGCERSSRDSKSSGGTGAL